MLGSKSLAYRSTSKICNLSKPPFLPYHLGRFLNTRIAELLNSSSEHASTPSSHVTVNGYVRSIRKQKRVAFAAVSDGSCVRPLQAVLSPDQAEQLSSGTAVSISGEWKASQGKNQANELVVDKVQIQGEHNVETYPMQKKYHSPDFLRTIPHLRVRSSGNALLLRFRSKVIADITQFFNERKFVQVHSPIITSSDCEGAGEVFKVEANQTRNNSAVISGPWQSRAEPFFGDAKYLTVSAQLHLEALCQSVGNVWTLSPTFRAEKSDTSRHLSEFYMLEAEEAFVSKLSDIMNTVEDLITFIAGRLKESNFLQEFRDWKRSPAGQEVFEGEEESFDPDGLSERWNNLLGKPWKRIEFAQAVTMLQEAEQIHGKLFESPPEVRSGLQTEHEKYLAETIYAGPLFVYNYPKSIKPFYMAPTKDTTFEAGEIPTVSCFDLLLPGVCETVGGSLREHRLVALEKAMEEKGLLEETTQYYPSETRADKADDSSGHARSGLKWYLDLRRYGSVPHGGFGLGFDRLLSFLTGIGNVRDIVTFPRHYKRCIS